MAKFLADYNSLDLNIVDGEGCFVFDDKGKKYIDFVGGWCVATVGWKNKKILQAGQDSKDRGLYIPPIWRWPRWEEFAHMLSEIAPGKLTRSFRCTSGSEAVEFAIKIARAATGKKTIVSVDQVYHGHTYGAASVGTALSSDMAPGVPEMQKIPMPEEYRGVSSDEAVAAFENIAKIGKVAGFLSEPVFTNAGAIIPPSDFYPRIAEVCKKYGVLLIMDEVASGFGRTGKLFASELWEIEPDIMCLGKAFSGGYATIGATLTTEEVFQKSGNIPAYSTFGWMPDDLIAAEANVKLILEEKLWENAERIGEYMMGELKPLERLPHVGIVRGLGLLFGIEIVEDKKTKKRAPELADRIQAKCMQHGLLIETAKPGNLFFTPALNIDRETAEAGIKILSDCLRNF